MQRTALLLIALAAPATAQGQTNKCAAIKSDAARLACYDRPNPRQVASPPNAAPKKPITNDSPNPTANKDGAPGER